jgi:hypothetical protein
MRIMLFHPALDFISCLAINSQLVTVDQDRDLPAVEGYGFNPLTRRRNRPDQSYGVVMSERMPTGGHSGSKAGLSPHNAATGACLKPTTP